MSDNAKDKDGKHARSSTSSDTAKGHEGKHIRAYLAENDKRPSDLARGAAVTQTSVGRYLLAEKLGAKAWETASRGLLALGLDPRRIRPNATLTAAFHEGPEDLRHLLAGFGKKHLEALKQILDAPPSAQHVLKIVVQDRLERGE